ncbi:hypothetical protein LIA77_07684 [Sarocladium implicatum]|nr:hypothetical protein LIA77_07684 [Sarocladium implicatum]
MCLSQGEMDTKANTKSIMLSPPPPPCEAPKRNWRLLPWPMYSARLAATSQLQGWWSWRLGWLVFMEIPDPIAPNYRLNGPLTRARQWDSAVFAVSVRSRSSR